MRILMRAVVVVMVVIMSACSTGAMYEDTAPGTIQATLEDGASGVDPAQNFEITFPKAINAATVTADSFFLAQAAGGVASLIKAAENLDTCSDPNATRVPATIEFLSEYQVRIVPLDALSSQASFVLCLTDAIYFADGNQRPATAISFATRDAEAPAVVTVVPAVNATDVAINTPVSVEFSEELAAENAVISLASADGEVDGSSSYDASISTISFAPSANLANGTLHTATVSADLADLAGNALGVAYTWSFTTVAAVQPDGGGEEVPVAAAPAAPANVQAVAGDAMVTITWNDVEGAVSYHLYWQARTAMGTWSDPIKIENVTSPYVHENLLNETPYRYNVSAENGGGESALSALSNVVSPAHELLGILDLDFNNVGFHLLPAQSRARAVAVQNDGKPIVAGSISNRMTLWRYRTDGALDTTFDSGKRGRFIDGVTQTNGHIVEGAHDLVIDPDGNVIVAGTSYDTDHYVATLWKYNVTTKSLDASFGTGGWMTLPGMMGSSSHATAILRADDGSFYVTGSSGPSIATEVFGVTWHVNSDGTLDATFHNNEGVAYYQTGWLNRGSFYDLALSGSVIYLVGQCFDIGSGGWPMCIEQISTDGEYQDLYLPGIANSYGFTIAVDGDGRLLVGGQSTDKNGTKMATVWRYLANGTLDTTFSAPDGYRVLSDGIAEGMVDDIKVLADGSILAVGRYDTAAAATAWRLTSSGGVDDTFNDDSGILTSLAGCLGTVPTVEEDDTGLPLMGMGLGWSTDNRFFMVGTCNVSANGDKRAMVIKAE